MLEEKCTVIFKTLFIVTGDNTWEDFIEYLSKKEPSGQVCYSFLVISLYKRDVERSCLCIQTIVK